MVETNFILYHKLSDRYYNGKGYYTDLINSCKYESYASAEGIRLFRSCSDDWEVKKLTIRYEIE